MVAPQEITASVISEVERTFIKLDLPTGSPGGSALLLVLLMWLVEVSQG